VMGGYAGPVWENFQGSNNPWDMGHLNPQGFVSLSSLFICDLVFVFVFCFCIVSIFV
jgi:hypothetical protein